MKTIVSIDKREKTSHMHQWNLRMKVINWVRTMQEGATQFKMCHHGDETIFSSCFALFILDLFGNVDEWNAHEKSIWIDYIRSYQDETSGYFYSPHWNGKANQKAIQQLTCFCLSALELLGGKSKYKLFFLDQWADSKSVFDYLTRLGCAEGRATTGNMAMFLGIFLTLQLEQYKDSSAQNRMYAWFDWHEKNQNKNSGFWGKPRENHYYLGFQNAFHQFVIYNYWKKKIPHYEKIVDCVLTLQDAWGHFAPIPGGGGCWDYDAADILINCGLKNGYRIERARKSLLNLHSAILGNQNEDGGFCETTKRPSSLVKALTFDSWKFVFSSHNPYLWYFKARQTLNISRKKWDKVYTHWMREGKEWEQSNMWDTWFRCLTIAQIEKTLDVEQSTVSNIWTFQSMIGLGYFQD